MSGRSLNRIPLRGSVPPPSVPPRIEARALEIGYDGVAILNPLDFRVEEGAIFAILGGSGTGKTTLLRALIGLGEPVAGRLITRADAWTGSRDGAPGFGVLFQSAALFGSLTVAQNVALPLQQWTTLSRSSLEAVVRAKLRLVGLEGFENHRPDELSGGMKKRAGIARALALDPGLLFLDEPSAGLDPISLAEIDELLLTLNRDLGVTLVMVTHELHSIERIVSDCILIDRAERGIVATGDPRELAAHSSHPTVRAFFEGGQLAPDRPEPLYRP